MVLPIDSTYFDYNDTAYAWGGVSYRYDLVDLSHYMTFLEKSCSYGPLIDAFFTFQLIADNLKSN